MYRLFIVLGFIVGWLAPFGVVYYNHVFLVDAGWDVDMFGLILVMLLVIGLMKGINKKVELWAIQDKHKIFIMTWNNAKKILTALFLTWVLYTIEDDLVKIQWSGVLITACFFIGYVLTLIGTLLKLKRAL